MKNLTLYLFLAILLCIASNAFGQKVSFQEPIDTLKMYNIELTDGTIIICKILQKDSVQLVVKTASIQQIEIPIIKLKSITELNISNFKNGKYWFPNPNSTRYLLGPSAFNLKKGEGYYQNSNLIFNSFNYGITDNISIGAGLELLSLISAGSVNPIFFINPKIGYKITDKFHAGGGVLLGTTLSGGLGITYAIGTFGTPDHNLTGSIGWGFIGGRFSKNPTVTVSGMTRISKKAALVTENWFIPGSEYSKYYSYGIRFFGEKLAVDLAFINNSWISDYIIFGIPYIDVVFQF
ncbi:MAG: hypothetical protein IPI60_16270 [Saprospiraceae bacterium]|nr:hypothetical protein [Saprospiraceae bacterium]